MNTKDLIVGHFYWIKASVGDAPATWQPAKFTGIDGDATGIATWDYVGLRSEDGHHFAKVEKVGREVAVC